LYTSSPVNKTSKYSLPYKLLLHVRYTVGLMESIHPNQI